MAKHKSHTSTHQRQPLPVEPTGLSKDHSGKRKEGKTRKASYEDAKLEQIRTAIENTQAELDRKEEKVRFAECGIWTHDPPANDLIRAKRINLSFKRGVAHIAVAGSAGQGRSRFVKAITGGLYDVSQQSHNRCCVNDVEYFDIPGAGSGQTERVDYFHKQHLYAFDAVIILSGDRITDLDIGIALMCRKCDIPYIFVRSRSDQVMREIQSEVMDEGVDENEVEGYCMSRLAAVREEMQQNLEKQLQMANLPSLETDPDGGFFLINSRSLLSKVLQKDGRTVAVDEDALLSHMGILKQKALQRSSRLESTAIQGNKPSPGPKGMQAPRANTAEKATGKGENKQEGDSAKDGNIHIAVVGASELGKSFIRAITGDHIGPLRRSASLNKKVFHLFPSSGASKGERIIMPDIEQYFLNHQLKNFQAVIILGPMALELGAGMAFMCDKYKVPYYFVWAHSNQFVEDTRRLLETQKKRETITEKELREDIEKYKENVRDSLNSTLSKLPVPAIGSLSGANLYLANYEALERLRVDEEVEEDTKLLLACLDSLSSNLKPATSPHNNFFVL